jgi:hypothetical protein
VDLPVFFASYLGALRFAAGRRSGCNCHLTRSPFRAILTSEELLALPLCGHGAPKQRQEGRDEVLMREL